MLVLSKLLNIVKKSNRLSITSIHNKRLLTTIPNSNLFSNKASIALFSQQKDIYHDFSTTITTKSEDIPRFVKIVEVGPRDGLQNESKFVPTQQKVQFISKLAQAGCPTIEITSFVSPKWIPQLSDAKEVVERVKYNIDDPFLDRNDGIGTALRHTTYAVLVPNVRGMKQAITAGADEIAIFASASETFSQKNVNCSIDEAFKSRFDNVAMLAKEYGIPMRGYISCALGCPYEGDVDVCDVSRVAERLMELGCYEISLADTIGVGTPIAVLNLLDEVQKIVHIDMMAVHFHDTYGQALANIYAALTKGISTIDSSVSGLGGCPYAVGSCGNVATEDVVYMLNGMDIRTGIDLSKLIHAGEFICNVLQHPTRSRVAKAILGKKGNNSVEDNQCSHTATTV